MDGKAMRGAADLVEEEDDEQHSDANQHNGQHDIDQIGVGRLIEDVSSNQDDQELGLHAHHRDRGKVGREWQQCMQSVLW